MLIAGLSLLSCGREVTGPEGGMQQAVFGLAPAFPAAFAVEGSGSVVPFNRVRVTLDRLDETRILTRVVDFPADQETVDLDLEVDLPLGTSSGGIDLILNMQYINAAGDTVFRAGPQTVTAVPFEDGAPVPVVPVDVEYVGVGSNAAFMDMAPAAATVIAGTTTQFSAMAYDANESEIPSTPFVFSSPDATLVTITPQGLATWLPVRGTARIIATLPTGELADTTTFTVSLPASQLVVVSGGGQSHEAGTPLEEPVVLRVTAADAVPVAGVTVTFTVATGGGSVEPASAISDANGLVSFAWTLGATVGAQSVTATYPGLATPVTIVANGGQSPAVDLQYVSGDEQTGTPGQPLAAPLVVRAVDVEGNGVPGVQVAFSVSLGGGSLEPAIATTDGTGHASSTWTLGASPGSQGAFAEVDGIQTVIGFSANAVSSGVAVWTGAVSNDWSVAGNWDINAVPSAADSVVIPAVATQPVLTATTTIVGAVNISAGTLWLNGRTLVTARDFATTGSGVLVMQEETAALFVGGNARFAGGNESGLLTLGALALNGNFTQVGTNSTASFQAEEGFVTSLQSAATVITFENPGPGPAESRFGDLVWVGGGTLTQQSGMTVGGTYVISSTDPATQLGIGGTLGRYLEVTNFFSSAPVTFDNVRVFVTQQPGEGQSVHINNVTWRNLPGDATRLIINAPGDSPFTLDNVVFESVPTTGFYIAATDNAPTDGTPLVVSVANPTPATPGAFTSVAGGATIEWPAGASRTWIGSVSTDWMDPANWFPSGIPGALDAVVIGSAVNAPALGATTTIGNLQVLSGVALSLTAGGNLTVNGDIAADGQVLDVFPNALLTASGVGRTIRGTLANVSVTGSYSLSGTLSVGGELHIHGSLNVAGGTVNTVNLATVGTGVLIMQDAQDFVAVGNRAQFLGGATAGLLTNGVLRVAGQFTALPDALQIQNSFAASGAHVVQFAGAGSPAIDMLSGPGPDMSHFANLDLSLLTGSLDFQRSGVTHYVTGQLISQPDGPTPTIMASADGQLHVGGVNVNGLVDVGMRLTIGGGTFTQFDNVAFGASFTSSGTQLTVDHPGNATPFAMNGLSFATAPTTGGFYMRANDTDGGAPALVVNVTATPTSPGGFVAASNGAVINWPSGAPVRVWTGAVNSQWNEPGNWVGGAVPASTDSVRIPDVANADPFLIQNTILSGLTIEDGGSLSLSSWTLTVQGSVHVPINPSLIAPGMGQFELQAAGPATVSGALPGTIIDNGLYTFTAPVTVNNGDLLIRNNGHLSIGGFQLDVNGSFATTDNGVLAMSGPANVVVDGNATFNGGSTADLLTGGTLFVGGAFAQGGASPTAFQASQGHTVELNGTVTQSVSLQDPDLTLNTGCTASCFGRLLADKGAGEGDVSFISSAKAVTQMGVTAENILAGTNTLVSGGAPVLNGTTIQARAIAFQTDFVHGATTFAVDSLFGFGNGVPLPANLVTPTRIVGNYFINAPHNAGLVVSFNALEVSGPGAVINGDLVMNSAGWLRMQQAADTLTVNGAVFTSGTPPISQLTGGVLQVNGDFWQTSLVGVASFNADPGHKTRFIGPPGSTIQFVDANSNRFGTVEFSTPSLQILSPATVTGDVIVLTTSGAVTGTVGQTITVNGGLYDTLGGQWQVPMTRFTGDPVLPNTIGSGVEFTNTVTLTHDLTINGPLALAGTSELILNSQRLSVLGAFTSVGNSRVRMTSPADTLSLSGSASFGGGNSAGFMTGGRIELYGDFMQSGVASSFSPTNTHQTWFLGGATQAVTFANPGTGAGLSHFSHVGLAQGTEGVSVSLLSDAFAEGLLMTDVSSARRLSAPVRRVLHSNGATIPENIEFDNVGWALVGDLPVNPMNGVRFVNMDPAQTQFSIQRSTGPLVITGLLEFETTPVAPGFYMRVEDPTGPGDGTLDVQLAGGVTPVSHGGFLQLVNATVTTWPGIPEFNWVGAVSADWTDGANWSGGLVPTAADSAYVPAGTPNAPNVNAGSEVRTLAIAPGAALNLGSDLTVHGSVDVAAAAAITSSDGTLHLSSASGGTLSGAIPQVRVTGGLFTLDGNVTVNGNVEIYGNEFTPGVPVEGDLSIGNFTLTSTGGLLVGLEGTFTMTGIGMADFATYVNFFGNSTAGKLTNGTLRVGTEFFQDGSDSPSSFQASGAHVTEFAGAAPEPRIFFTDPDVSPNTGCTGSCFATLRSVKAPGQGGLRFESGAKILGALQLQADSVSAPGFTIMSAGAPTFDTPILRAGAIGHEGVVTQNASTIAVDSLVAWAWDRSWAAFPACALS